MRCNLKRSASLASVLACAASVLVAETSHAQMLQQHGLQHEQVLTSEQQRTPTTGQPQEKQFAVTYVPSVRFDLIAGSVTAVQLGAGLMVPMSNYFALGGTLGAGISETGFSGRGDLFTRFSLDPYHRYNWEPYFGLGGTVRLDTGGPGTRSYLLGFFGFNGPSTGRIAPGFELGVGGGIRLGVTLRWAK